jgi:hypothetical protein
MKAPGDGSPLWIGYQDITVTAPDGKAVTEWKYEWEPAHGDGLFSVRFRGRLLPQLFWGRGHAWSPASDYFTLEQHTSQDQWFLFVVRVWDSRWFRIAENAGVDRFAFPSVDITHGGREAEIRSRYEFSGNEKWVLPAFGDR